MPSKQPKLQKDKKGKPQKPKTNKIKMGEKKDQKMKREKSFNKIQGFEAANRLSKVARAIAGPINVSPIRWASEYATAPTAVAAPYDKETMNWNTTSTPDGTSVPASSYGAFMFRDPLRHTVRYENRAVGQEWGYNMNFKNVKDGQFPSPFLNMGPLVSGEIYPLKTVYGTDNTLTSTPGPHGATWFAGTNNIASDDRFFYLAAGNTITMAFTNATTGVSTLYLDLYAAHQVQRGIQTNSTASGTSGTHIVNVTASGYYNLRIGFSTAQPGGAIITGCDFTGLSTWGHRSLPNLENNIYSAENIRIISSSIMMTNKAAPLYREGKVSAVQVPRNIDWETLGLDLTMIQSMQGATTMEFKNGVYAFIKPTQPEDFDFKQYLDVHDVVGLVDSYYPLDNESSYIGIYADVSVASGRDSYMTVCSGIEYQTEDTWRVLSQSKFTNQDIQLGMQEIKDLAYVYENETHWSQILDFIERNAKKVANAVVQYGPGAIQLASKLL